MSEITINYTYSKQFKPDSAYINVYFSLNNQSKDYLLSQFKSINNQLSLLFSNNVKLVSYCINPNYKINNNIRDTNGYILLSSFILKLKLKDNNLDNALDKLNSIENLTYSVDFKLHNEEKYKNEVLKETIELANKKAEFIAKQLNKKIDEIKSINYSSYDNNTSILMLTKQSNSFENMENINIEQNVNITYIIS